MVFNTILYTAIVTSIIGLVWSFALDFSILDGLLYGGLIGVIIGLLLSFLNKAIINRGNVQRSEAGFMSGSILGLLLLAGVGTGLITWIVRAIFF
jgi:hypothetical protein